MIDKIIRKIFYVIEKYVLVSFVFIFPVKTKEIVTVNVE